MSQLKAFGSLFFALSLRHHQQKWGRFALMLSGVIIAVAVSASIRATNDRVIGSFSETLTNLSGKANLQLTVEGGLDREQLWGLEYLWDVGWFTPYVQLTATHQGTPIQLYGFDFLADQQIRNLGTDKREGEQTATGLWVPPDSPLLQDSKIVDMVIAGQPARFQVAGTLKTINGRLPPRGAAFVDLDVIKPFYPQITGLDIWVEAGALESVRAKLQAQFPAAQLITVSQKQQFTTDMLSAFQMNLGALGLVALLVCCYLVYNSLNLAVLQRQTDMNVLVALGAKPKQLFWVLLAEGLMIGVIGGAIGAVFGWLLSRFSYAEVSQSITALFHLPDAQTAAVYWSGPLLSMGLGVLSCLVAAWFPARQATSISTASGLKNKVREYQPGAANRAGWAGLGLLVASVLLVFYALETHSVWPGFGAIFLSLLGLSFMAPYILSLFARLFQNAQGAGLLMRASVQTHLFKLAIAIAALTVALSMAGSISVMVHSFRATFTEWLNLTIQADLYVKSESKGEAPVGNLPTALEAKIRALPFVRNTLSLYLSRAYLKDREIDVGANQMGDPDFQKMIHLISQVERPYQQAVSQGGAIISEVLADKTGLSVGDSFPLYGQQVPVLGVFQNFSSQRGMVYVDRSFYVRHLPNAKAAGLGIFMKPGTDPQKALIALRAQTTDWKLDFRISEQIKQKALQIFEQTFRLTRLLQTIAFGISLLAVVATLSTLVVERKGELSVLLALGSSPNQLKLALLMESLGLTAVALLLSGFGALSLSWILVEVINRFSFGWTIFIKIPWQDLFEIGGLITLGAVLATLAPARLISQLNPASILKAEG